YSTSEFSSLLSIYGVVMLMAHCVLVPVLTPRLGERRVIQIGLFMQGLQMVMFGLAQTHSMVTLSTILVLGGTLYAPPAGSMVAAAIPDEGRGKLQ
ncbi:hypothetical protein SARC_17068, partial [Sphaeroforma arctica JP610]